ncbi:WSC domain-containing protein 1-like [Mizuhopecten yessoensis]|uniref:Xylosyltransferase oxt n=1 Tax=Mizuhopecten yessoensis TaxID=6573 RepID=A0A210PGS3_MIZYE|nr:WSC domain-containing protein 1-like [Mizuhopecten yessoensis]OWF35685.1 Xylosyltransferase oxt [Mizuhopecten yessoensis]
MRCPTPRGTNVSYPVLFGLCEMAILHAPLVLLVLVDFVEGAYIGCFNDIAERLLKENQYSDSQLTTDKCIQYCFQHGNTLAGTQYSTQCFCGNDIDMNQLTTEDACSRACGGNQSETCGGTWKMSVYSTDYQTTTESTVLATTQSVEIVNNSCICHCNKTSWIFSTNLTTAQQQEILSELQAQLTVSKKSTSTYKRKFNSEYDSRPSSMTMGYVAAAILAIMTVVVVVPDVIRLVLYAQRCLHCNNRK